MAGTPMFPGFDAAAYPEDLGGLNVTAYLDALVARLGCNRAASELGVAYNTVRRWQRTASVSATLRTAVERRLAGERDRTEAASVHRDHPASADRTPNNVDPFSRLSELETRLDQVLSSANRLQSEGEEIQSSLKRLSTQVETVKGSLSDAVQRLDRIETAVASSTASCSELGASSDTSDTRKSSSEDDALTAAAEGWRRSKEAVAIAKSGLDRARAMLAQRRSEIALLDTFEESIPPGERWGYWRRRQELEWRVAAAEDLENEVRHRVFRRRVRQILTLSLWRS